MRIVILIFLLFSTTFALAQNKTDFFKSWQQPNKSMPEWAQLMYSENPNVHRVVALYESYYKRNTFIKTIHTQNYKYWLQKVRFEIDSNGFIKTPKSYLEIQNKFIDEQREIDQRKNQSANARIAGASTQWVSLGPKRVYHKNTTLPVSYSTNIYCIEQSISNPNIVYCGSESGGLFKSTDKGINWTPVSNGLNYSGGNSAIGIHPNNPDIVLFWGNQFLFKTINGGITWNLIPISTTSRAYEIKFNPLHPDTVYLVGAAGLYRSINFGDTWTQIYTDECYDVDFHPTNPSILYLLKKNTAAKRPEVFKSTNGGASFSLKATNYYVPSDLANASISGGKIAVSAISPSMVYVCLIGDAKLNDDGWIGIYKSEDEGENWTRSASQDGGPYGTINGTAPWNVAAYSDGYHQGFYNFDFEASNVTPGKLWVATIRLSETVDSGKTFISIGSANSIRLTDIHADVQSISVQGNDIFVATDGGVDYSNDELQTQNVRSYNLTDVNFWQFNTGWNQESFTGGTYHDGTMGWHEGFGLGNAYRIGGVEEPSGYVHPIEDRKMIYRTHYSAANSQVNTLPDTIGQTVAVGTALPVRPNESYYENRTSGFYYHPQYANIIFMGYENKIYKSTDAGANWTEIYALTDTNGLVFEIEISTKNPNVMYCTFNPDGGFWTSAQMIKTIDGGVTWSPVTFTGASGSKWQIAMTINPLDENEIWIALGDISGSASKVFQSVNGGTSWVSKHTVTLNNMNLYDIMYTGASTAMVYVVGSNGVLYYNNTNNTWNNYSNGLPTVLNGFRIHPYFKDNEILIGSSRGAWVRSMADSTYLPVAEISTYTDSIFCGRDTVQFESRSRIAQNGATWLWNFSPAPLYISNVNARNPKVVFGNVGSYDVSLTITDASTNMASKALPNMVYVKNSCDVDSFTENSLVLNGSSNSYASGKPLNVTTNNFTVSAWIKRNGIQNSSTAVMFMRGVGATGLNVSDSTMGYHWGNNYWWWNSNQTIPNNKWVHVALVITPTRASLYVDGVPKHNVAAHSAISLNDNVVIGRDMTSGTRVFKGEIDEVCIWNRALDSNEIRAFRHLTKIDTLSDPSLLAYYQFNEGNKIATDKKLLNHLTLNSAATTQLSTAPVGYGTSHKLNVNSAGIYNFSNAGCEMTFAPGILPNGNIVVSRIQNQPDSITNNIMLHNNYWIVNNYGTNKTFTPLTNLKLYPYDSVLYPNQAMVEKRGDNEHISNWAVQCNTSNVQTGANGYYEFDASCNNATFSQFTITTNNATLPIEILSFNAFLNSNNTVLLKWLTNDYKEVSHFEIEHSTDAIHFNSIGSVYPNNLYKYEFLHTQPVNGKNYYRLKSVELDHNTKYSLVKQVTINNEKIFSPIVNPVTAGGPIQFYSNFIIKNAQLNILNTSGQVIYKKQLSNTNEATVDIQLSAGIYYYQLFVNKEMIVGKVIVQ